MRRERRKELAYSSDERNAPEEGKSERVAAYAIEPTNEQIATNCTKAKTSSWFTIIQLTV